MGQQSHCLSSDKRLWSQVYRTFKEMLKSQQSQIETLINDREFMEDYVRIQHEQWSSNARLLQSRIAQMKDEQAKIRLVDDAMTGVLVGFRESEALCYKMQLELAESDLEDFRSCVGVIGAEMEELKEKLNFVEDAEVKDTDYKIDHTGSSESIKGSNKFNMSLKMEIKKLKRAYKELSSRKDNEVSALLVEKDFVWNQFRKMESDYIALLKCKRAEAHHQMREAAEKLQDSVEKLQREINQKDEIIVKLEAERTILELDVRKHAEEAEQANNKMKKLHTDMNELSLEAMEKEKVIAILREELCNLKTDLEKKCLEKSNSSEKNNSERKSKNGSATIIPIHLQRCSKKCNLGSCDTDTSHGEGLRTDKMKRLHTDMNELRLEAMEKDKLISSLREELCNLKTDLEKNSHEKFNSSEKNNSEGKLKNGSATIRPIHLPRCSKKRKFESCDTDTSQKRTNFRRVTFETPASDNVHRLDKELKRGKIVSPVVIQPPLFHSDFKVPKLKRSRQFIT